VINLRKDKMPARQDEDFYKVERNLFEYAFESGINGTGVVLEDARAMYFCSSLAIPALNLAYMKAVQPEERDLASIELFFREHGNPYTIWLPNDESAYPALVRHGLDHCTNLQAMIANLEDSRPEHRPPIGYRLLSVNKESDMDAFARAAFAGNEMPTDIYERFSDFIWNLSPSKHPQNEIIVALKGEEPVASGLMFRGKEVTGLYWISVVPYYRNRGLGSWLTQELLRIGKEEGYRQAVLQSSPIAANVYRRLGFKEVGSFQVYSH
jgi:ribosomal protein S18 acetylase RimI-like enzyme